MALNNLGLGLLFDAKDRASPTIKKVDKNFKTLDNDVEKGSKRMMGAFKQIAKGAALMFAGTKGMKGMFGLAKQAGEFEFGLAAVGAVTRATTAELDMLSEAAVQAGIKTEFSPDQAVQGLQALATAGQSATQATRTLVPVLDLAAGSLGQLGVGEAAQAVVGTLNAYGMEAGNATKVTDKLLRITQMTNFQARDFGIGLSKAAAAGAQFGTDLDDVLITLGLLRNRNIDASSSATAFREAIRRLASDQKAQRLVTKKGVDIYDQQTGKMRSVLDVMRDLGKQLQGVTDEERNRVVAQAFGARGLLAFSAATVATDQQINKMRRDLQEEGVALDFVAKKAATFKGEMTLLQGSTQTLRIVVGQFFAKVFKPMVARLRIFVNNVIEWWRGLDGTTKLLIAKLGTMAMTILSVVGALVALRGVLKLLAIAWKTAGMAKMIGGFKKLLLVVGLLGPVVLGLKTAWDKNIGGMQTKTTKAFGKIRLAFVGIGQLLTKGVISGPLAKDLMKAENKGVRVFINRVMGFIDKLKQFFGGIAMGFVNMMQTAGPAFEGLVGAIDELGDALGMAFGMTGKATKGMGQYASTGEKIGAVLGKVAILMVKGLTLAIKIMAGVIRIAGKIWDAVGPILTKLGKAIVWVGEKVSDLVTWFLDLFGVSEKAAGGVSKATDTMENMVVWLGKAALAIWAVNKALKFMRGGWGRFLRMRGGIGSMLGMLGGFGALSLPGPGGAAAGPPVVPAGAKPPKVRGAPAAAKGARAGGAAAAAAGGGAIRKAAGGAKRVAGAAWSGAKGLAKQVFWVNLAIEGFTTVSKITDRTNTAVWEMNDGWQNTGVIVDELAGGALRTFSLGLLGTRSASNQFWMDMRETGTQIELNTRKLEDQAKAERKFSGLRAKTFEEMAAKMNLAMSFMSEEGRKQFGKTAHFAAMQAEVMRRAFSEARTSTETGQLAFELERVQRELKWTKKVADDIRTGRIEKRISAAKQLYKGAQRQEQVQRLATAPIQAVGLQRRQAELTAKIEQRGRLKRGELTGAQAEAAQARRQEDLKKAFVAEVQKLNSATMQFAGRPNQAQLIVQLDARVIAESVHKFQTQEGIRGTLPATTPSGD